MISLKNQEKLVKVEIISITSGVIRLIISTFTELPCSLASSFPIELTKLKNRSINNHENLHE